MKKRIYLILFLTLIFSFGKEISAQATCEGTIQASTLAAWPAGTQIGDGTPGDIKVCITANNIAQVGMGCNVTQLVVSTAAGSGITVIWDETTPATTCYTFTTGTGFGFLAFNGLPCLVAGTDATFTWETVDGADVNQCAAPTCSDLIMNQDETGIDCGGVCPPCGAPSCSDLVQNQDETGIDCGGVCPACAVATDGCTDAPLVAADSSCTTGTTVGASDSWSGTPGCQSGDGHPDVWFEFTATGTNSEITVENGTMTGDVEIILVQPNCGSDNCTCPFVLIGSSCGASPNTGTFNTVSGQDYYYTISSSTGSQGTFTSCVESNNDVAPGQDCNTAQILCGDGGFSVGNLQNGTGAVNESSWMSCASEQNTQWYTFTAATDGSFSAMVEPATWTAPTTGDDYDFALLDITASGCTVGTTIELACDYSPCQGSTGFSAGGAADFGQVSGTDFRGDNPAGPADCTEGSAGSQWNANAVNLTAGNTYAYMIQNYSGSTGGATVTFGGTTSLVLDPSFTASIGGDCYTMTIDRGTAYTGANMTYDWDFGDTAGTSTAGVPGYAYTGDNTYTVTLTVTNPAGCTASASASVTTGCPVPITLNHFSAECIGEEVKLFWSTASEENNAGFTLQRSEDGNTFKNIGKVNGAGKSTSLIEYDYVDKKPLRKGSYYRLKQLDFDGNSDYSKIIRVENCGDYGITVLPNPSKGVFNLIFDYDIAGDYDITVFDITGKKIITQKLDVEAKSDKNYTIDITNFEKGIYIMKVSDESGSINLKIITE